MQMEVIEIRVLVKLEGNQKASVLVQIYFSGHKKTQMLFLGNVANLCT